MKNTNKPALSLRTQSIRNLDAAELRGAVGGIGGTGNGTCTHSHRTLYCTKTKLA